MKKKMPKKRGKTITGVALHFTWDNGLEEFFTDWEEHNVSGELDDAISEIEASIKGTRL